MAQLSIAKYSRIVGSDRTKLATAVQSKYRKGVPIRAIAAEYGRSYGFIHRLLLENGVELRGRGGPNRKRAAKPGA